MHSSKNFRRQPHVRAWGVLAVWLVLLSLWWSQSVQADTFICPPREAQYAARDYLNPEDRRKYLRAVESHHFNNDVRTLRGGARGVTSTLIGDLEYTLNWFPNHHEALDALVRLVLRENNPRPLGAKVRVECRFQWAMHVNPGDGMVPMLYGTYLQRVGKRDEARRMLERAVELAPDNANVRYNVGLLMFRMNDHQAALEHARRAYALGFPLPGLRNMLEQAGYRLNE